MPTPPQPRPLRAGAAAVDITPAMGIQIAGDIGRPRPVEEIRDPIYARALVLDDGAEKLCLLSLDLLAVNNRCADDLRSRIAHRFGFDFNAVMFHVTQNHSAPTLGHILCRDECPIIKPEHEWLRMGDRRYDGFAMEQTLRAVEQAVAALQPATIGAASDFETREAFNRRYVLRDGTAACNPWGETAEKILHVEGPADPEVGVVGIKGADGRMISILLHHTCHPTHGYPTRYISADWPGAWCNAMRDKLGPQCVPLVINGCCGNVIHINWAEPTWISDQHRMGRHLGEAALRAIPRIEYRDAVALDFRDRKIQIPLRELDPEMIAKARKLIADHPEPMWKKNDPGCVEWDWLYAVGRVNLADLKAAKPCHDYEIQVFKIGDIAIPAVTGEPFVEGQLKIKMLSPVRHTYIAHMSNGYVGYIPTPEAIPRGGYETWPGNWSRLAPEALEMIVQGTVGLIREVF